VHFACLSCKGTGIYLKVKTLLVELREVHFKHLLALSWQILPATHRKFLLFRKAISKKSRSPGMLAKASF